MIGLLRYFSIMWRQSERRLCRTRHVLGQRGIVARAIPMQTMNVLCRYAKYQKNAILAGSNFNGYYTLVRPNSQC